MIISFCGHADFDKTKECEEKILAYLEEKICGEKVVFYLGGYGDFDALALDCCKKYKRNHANVTIIFITPYITEDYQKNRLKYLSNEYDGIIYPEIENKPLRFAITYRNRWMMERADVVICGIYHTSGGAYKSYLHAKKRKKTVFNVTGVEL